MLTRDLVFGLNILNLADLLLCAVTAMIAHLVMSLGQTLFHQYLGHSRLGGRFFKHHIQFPHAHYAGDHVVSTHYLDNGDNNTLFFLFPVFLIVGLSYLFLRLDLLVVQFTAMSLSFCGHYYLDNQYHVAGSWLGRFSWFRRKQQLHFIHHRHGDCNFAVIDFFWDRLLGTYCRVEPGGCPVTSAASPRLRPTESDAYDPERISGCQDAIYACVRPALRPVQDAQHFDELAPDAVDTS